MEKENDINKNNNNENNNIYLRLKKFHDFFESKSKQENKSLNNGITKIGNESEINKIEDNENDIYIKYLKDNNIIFPNNDNNNENFKLIVQELNNDIDNRKNIFLPFLDITPNLVKAYIESDFDNFKFEEEIPGEPSNHKKDIIQSFYQQFFQKLKNNCFINKEPISYIYKYFSNLYDKVDKIKKINKEKKEIIEDDIIQLFIHLKKFNKNMNLFKIFYEKNNNDNISSICSIGGNFKVLLNKPLLLSEGYKLIININLLDYYFEDINKNLNIIKINNTEQKYECSLIDNNNDNDKLKSINFTIESKVIYTNFKKDKKEIKLVENVELTEISEIYILENFYGQISSIEIFIEKDVNRIEYYFLPISIRNENNIYYYKKIYKRENMNEIQKFIPRIIVCNPNLVKINYLNYNDKKFDIIDYYGGIIQFLPFYHIFNILCDKNLIKINYDENSSKDNLSSDSIILNKSIENSATKILNEHIKAFINFLLKIILNKLDSTKNKIKYFKKYVIFIYSLILNIDLALDLIFDFDKNKEKNEKIKIYSCIDLLIMTYYNYKNSFSFDTKNEIGDLFYNNETKNEIKFDILKIPKKSFNQLYSHFMKKLFIFNGFWSKKNLFFKKINRNSNERSKEIKYKQLNYYTKNFQLPYFYPILELRKYYPNFSKLKNGIFMGDDIDMMEYNFGFENGKSALVINTLSNEINKNKKENKEIKEIYKECCLVKNTHHVAGILIFINKKNKNKQFKLIFKQHKNKLKTCNKHFIENKKLDKKDDNKERIGNNDNNKDIICYGSVFPTPEKEFNKSIFIKSKDILFILFRIYFHRTSAIEIFTINNKSYYFNFYQQFEINNLKRNEILKEIKNNPFFKEIKLKKEKIVLGFYNSLYESYLFPLFKDEINVWEKKINYFSNYDIIILINIFSNRSYRDVYQFPVFPTLYNWICQKRDMSQPIGLQEILNESKARKKTMISSYNSKEDEETEADEENYLFNIHYSNPAFTFNYLLRVLPYSFLAVEFQGDDFDNPNRLFYSIEKSLKSNLTLKSDLREMIPELYYMFEIFYNKNNLFLDTLYDGRNIEYVEIIPMDDQNYQSENDKKQTIAEFLSEMRKYLELEKDVDKWINIIFGKWQKKSLYNNKEYQNYEKCREISFKNEQNLLENTLCLEYVDFGLLPLQIFNNDFQKKDMNLRNKIEVEIQKLNLELFKEEHLNKINSSLECFICKGSTLINNDYIKLIDPKEQINILDYYEFPNKYLQKLPLKSFNKFIFKKIIGCMDINEINERPAQNSSYLNNFYFIGDIYGSVYIYSLLKAKKDADEEKNEQIEICSFDLDNDNNLDKIKNMSNSKGEIESYNSIKYEEKMFNILKGNKTVFEFELKLIKKLCDHTKEIKYIDFNPRLNILLTYSIDNYINIYIFPKLKLINVIDVNSFKEKNDLNYLDEVVPISFPFPMIICHNKEYIYLLSINGDFIKNEKLKENQTVSFYVDKNLGLSEDMVEISDLKVKHYFNYIVKKN